MNSQSTISTDYFFGQRRTGFASRSLIGGQISLRQSELRARSTVEDLEQAPERHSHG
jgi:hypothetical protein